MARSSNSEAREEKQNWRRTEENQGHGDDDLKLDSTRLHKMIRGENSGRNEIPQEGLNQHGVVVHRLQAKLLI